MQKILRSSSDRLVWSDRAVDEDDEDLYSAKRAVNRRSSPVMVAIERSLAHKWGKHGDHIGWTDFDELQNSIYRIFGYELPKSTAYRMRQIEMENFNDKSKKAHLTRPNISELIKNHTENIMALKKLEEEPSFATTSNIGRPYTFFPEWHEELALNLDQNKYLPGFGTLYVQVAAAQLYKEKTADMLVPFVPSVQWCRWFLRQSGFVVRRRSKHKATLKEIEA